MDVLLYVRCRHQTAEQWRQRLEALTEAERDRLQSALEKHGADAAMAQWPDLIEISTRPFPDDLEVTHDNPPTSQ